MARTPRSDGIPTPRTLRFRCRGHRHIRATHVKTLELTKAPEMTARGTCIVGVGADFEVREVGLLRGEVEVVLRVGEVEERVRAVVTPFLGAWDTLVLRRSDERHGRTFAYGADKGAADLDRMFVKRLQDPAAVLEVEIRELPRERGVGAPEPAGVLWVAGRTEAEAPGAELRRVLEAVDAVACPGRMPAWLEVLEPRVEHLPLGGGLAGADQVGEVLARLRGDGRVALLVGAEGCPAGSAELEVVDAAWELGLLVSAPGAGPPWTRALAAAGFPFPPLSWMPPPPRGRGPAREWLLRYATAATSIVLLRELQLLPVLSTVATHQRGRPMLLVRNLGERGEVLLRRRAGDDVPLAPRGTPGWVWLVLRAVEEPEEGAAEQLGAEWVDDGEGGGAATPLTASVPESFLEALLAAGVPVKTAAQALERATGESHRKAYRRLLELGRSLDEEGDG